MDLFSLDALVRDLTPHQLKILQAIYNSNGIWLSRSETARALGKKRLTPYDITCLDRLAADGLIQTSTRPSKAPGSDFAYIYNMSDDVAQLLYEWANLRAKLARGGQRDPLDLTGD